MKDAAEKDAAEVGSTIVRQSGIMNDIYQDRTPENLSRQENIEELVNGMHDFCATRREEGNEHVALTDYLAEVSLLTDQDNEKEGEGAKITLMTIHSAKGLEFKNVFVVGLEENLFPSQMSMDSMRGLEEERRLFYVAITRAEEHCYLSFAKSRYKFGKTEFSSPSRFLKDIDTRFLSLPQGERMASQVDEAASRFRSQPMNPRFSEVSRPKVQIVPAAQPTRTLKKVSSISTSRPAASPSVGALQVGNVIEHERFGVGEVVNVVGVGDNSKATVRFRNAGEKQLLLKFARFKIIS
jgi:DNA helicase-2/ATP-dependent DNA helicase PcrA